MYSLFYFFFFGYEICLLSAFLIPQWAVSLCVSSAIASVVRSTHAALSPFQSQYFVFITADCFKGGEHINTETCSYYVTIPSLHHTTSVLLHLIISRHVHWDITTLYLVFFCIHSSLHLFCIDLSLLHSPSLPSIFVSPAAGNEYLIYSLSLLSDGLRE